jgi:hypothetical protein
MGNNIIPIVILIVYAVLTIGAANILLKKKLGSDHFLAIGLLLCGGILGITLTGSLQNKWGHGKLRCCMLFLHPARGEGGLKGQKGMP